MTHVLHGNFAFEHELADPAFRGSPELQRLDLERSITWGAVAGDAVLVPDGTTVEAGFAAHLVRAGLGSVEFVTEADVGRFESLRPWGWSVPPRRLVERLGLNDDAPPIEAVRRANARSFSATLEREFDCGLPGTRVLGEPTQLSAAVRDLPEDCDRWVLKAEFGMSARERFLGLGREVPDQAVHWARRRTTNSGVVVLEPWVDRIAEAGLQFTIPPAGTGPPALEGVTPLLVDDFGRYRGSQFGTDAADWADAIAIGRRVAERVAALGYVGPLGIDACRYRDSTGEVRLRPIQDVNARFTMGRSALGLRRLLRPCEQGTWYHVRWGNDPAAWLGDLAARAPADVRVVRTSPLTLNGEPVIQGSLALLGPGESVEGAESIVFG